jgi:hypothetical protein
MADIIRSINSNWDEISKKYGRNNQNRENMKWIREFKDKCSESQIN